MRWPWTSGPEPVLKREPDHGRDGSGRLFDGDTVLPPGTARWADLLPTRTVDALTEDTALVPVLTPARRLRGEGGGWR